ncbi:MAG: amidohydrolase family protein [Desulfomonilaceae bacterium]
MPLLDFHTHVATRHQWNPWVMSYFAEVNPEYTENMSEKTSPQAVIEYLKSQSVDAAVVLSEYAPKTTGVVTNEFTAALCWGTDTLIPFGSISFNNCAQPAVQAEQCVTTLGCRGLKLLPSYVHIYPADPRLYPVYDVACAFDVPVMFHTGTSIFKGSRVRFGHPLLLDDVADDFPRLKIIMCHGGRPFWYAEAEWMLRRHKNVYVDISGIPPIQLPQVFPYLEKFRDRFIFGSDWPGIRSISEQVRKIQELPLNHDTMEAILWENGVNLLTTSMKCNPLSAPTTLNNPLTVCRAIGTQETM